MAGYHHSPGQAVPSFTFEQGRVSNTNILIRPKSDHVFQKVERGCKIQAGRGSGRFGSCQMFPRFRRFRRSVSVGSAVQAVQVEFFDRPKIIMSKSQIVVSPENDVFDIFEGIGCQLRFQILNWMKRADRCFGVCPNSAWNPSYEFFFLEIAKI